MDTASDVYNMHAHVQHMRGWPIYETAEKVASGSRLADDAHLSTPITFIALPPPLWIGKTRQNRSVEERNGGLKHLRFTSLPVLSSHINTCSFTLAFLLFFLSFLIQNLRGRDVGTLQSKRSFFIFYFCTVPQELESSGPVLHGCKENRPFTVKCCW